MMKVGMVAAKLHTADLGGGMRSGVGAEATVVVWVHKCTQSGVGAEIHVVVWVQYTRSVVGAELYA